MDVDNQIIYLFSYQLEAIDIRFSSAKNVSSSVDKIDFIAHVYIQSLHKLARQWWFHTNLTPNMSNAADVCKGCYWNKLNFPIQSRSNYWNCVCIIYTYFQQKRWKENSKHEHIESETILNSQSKNEYSKSMEQVHNMVHMHHWFILVWIEANFLAFVWPNEFKRFPNITETFKDFQYIPSQ